MAPSAAFDVPPGLTANVSMIDTTGYIEHVPFEYLCGPPIDGVKEMPLLPCYAFLIEGPDNRKVLFDLGIRKDWENYAPSVVDELKTAAWSLRVERSILEILQEQGYRGEDFEAVIWSHYHWDHLGNPAEFPPSTKIIVGPGFKEAFLPAYPTNKNSPVVESDFEGRELQEVDFTESSNLMVGKMRAYDYFGNGSFYLLDTPGHAIGHICGLVRTTSNADIGNGDAPDTFILLAGDAIHHAGELRPSPWLPIPDSIKMDDFASFKNQGHNGFHTSVCPGHLLEELQVKRNRKMTEPFLVPTLGHDIPEAIRTIEKVQTADWRANIFTIFAHDVYLYNFVEQFPKKLNHWKTKGWAEKNRWLFLDNLLPGIDLSNN